MDEVERQQWLVLLAMICLLVGWNYWLEKFFFSTPFALFGGGFGDFEVFRMAGSAWLSHENPYVASPLYIYPPTALPFFALFALLPFHFAGQVWWATYFVFFVFACVCLTVIVKPSDRKRLFDMIVALLFLTSYPLLILFQQGQIDLLVEALAVLSLVALRVRHDTLSAVILSFSVLLKGPAVLLLAYFVLFRRDLHYLLRFFGSVMAVVGLSLLILPINDYWYYLSHVIPTLSSVLGATANQSIEGMLSIADLSYVIVAVSFAGLALFAFFSYWAGNRSLPFHQTEVSSDAMFLMNVLVMLLFNPRSFIYPYVWVIIPTGLFLSSILMERVRTAWLAPLGFGVFLLNSNLVPPTSNLAILPLELVGNVVVLVCLAVLYLRPLAVINSTVACGFSGTEASVHGSE